MALYAYDAANPDDLSMQEGEQLVVIEIVDADWVKARNTNGEFLFDIKIKAFHTKKLFDLKNRLMSSSFRTRGVHSSGIRPSSGRSRRNLRLCR